MSNRSYPEYGVTALGLCGTTHNKIINTMKDVLLSEAKDNNTSLVIKDIGISVYPCKCLFNVVGFIDNKSFDILGKEKTVTEAYNTIRQELFLKRR